MLDAVNRTLDGLVRPEVPIFGRPRSAFRVCGFAGAVVAAALTIGLAWSSGRSIVLIAILLLTAIVVFLVGAIVSKAMRGAPNLVFHRHAIAIGAADAGVLAVLGESPLPYLDLVGLGLGAFLVCGRVGCLMVGCCTGRPSRLGVRYRREHVDTGFSSVLVGVRLFPSQALEAAVVLALTTGGAIRFALGARPGAVLAMLAVGYALSRFVIELTRGDRFRPVVGGFSEAQWIAVLAVGAVLAAGHGGLLPEERWHVAAMVGLGFAMFFILSWRYLSDTPRHQLLHPRHIHECAVALDRLGSSPASPGRAITVATTSLGVRLSLAPVATPSGRIEHVAISHRDGPMPIEAARIVTDLICQLRPSAGRHQIVCGARGVFHLLIHR